MVSRGYWYMAIDVSWEPSFSSSTRMERYSETLQSIYQSSVTQRSRLLDSSLTPMKTSNIANQVNGKGKVFPLQAWCDPEGG